MAKSKYDTHIKPYLDVIAQMKRDGCTDKEIMERFDVARNAFYEYKRKYKEFEECLNWSKEIAIDTVKNSLFMKCNGYCRKVQRPIKVIEEYDDNGTKCRREKVIIIDVLEEVPKDTNAIKFFLMNRDAKNWTEKKKIEFDEEVVANCGIVTLPQIKPSLVPPNEEIETIEELEKEEKKD